MPLHSLHHRAKHSTNNGEYIQLLVTRLLSSTALSVVAIFLPIYLLELGKSLPFVALYFVGFYVVKYLHHSFLTVPIIRKIGLKHALTLAFVLFGVSYVLIAQLHDNLFALSLSMLLLPLAEALRWDAQHLDMLLFTSKKNEGIQVGVAHAIDMLGQVLGPLTAGLLTEAYGPEATLVLGAVLLVSSSLPLFLSKEIPDIKIESPDKEKQHQKPPLKARVANFASNYESGISFLIWPIFIYLLVDNDFSALGVFFSAGFLVSALVGVALSRLGDRNKQKRDSLISLTALLRFLAHFLRLFTFGVPMAVAANTTGEVGSSVKAASFGVRFYDYGKESASKLHYIRRMELWADGGKLAGWVAFFILYTLLGDQSFKVLFMTAMLVAILITQMRKES